MNELLRDEAAGIGVSRVWRGQILIVSADISYGSFAAVFSTSIFTFSAAISNIVSKQIMLSVMTCTVVSARKMGCFALPSSVPASPPPPFLPRFLGITILFFLTHTSCKYNRRTHKKRSLRDETYSNANGRTERRHLNSDADKGADGQSHDLLWDGLTVGSGRD